ncbi:MAG: hypothetical protein EBT75_07530 [Proteobacteria bacterium]|nr:hypothetical protein [Pseudomonadota bacterium]
MATTYSVEQLLVKESGRIGPDIYRKTVDTSPWLKLVKQDAWPDEMGDSISTLIYERSLPYDSSGNLKASWTTLQSNAIAGAGSIANDGLGTDSASSNVVAPLGGTVEFGTRLRSYNLQHTSLNSPDVSLNDLRFPLKRKEQLSNIMSILTESTREVWVERYRDEYIRLSENKLTATLRAAGAGENTTFGIISKPDTTNDGAASRFGAPDTSVTTNNLELTQGMLDRLYFALLRDGAAAEAYSRINGAPVFLLITSMEASDALIRANADVRQDFRWSDRVNELLAPLGVQRTYRNYFHLVDPFLPRYNYDTGTSAWVRVRPYTRATTANEANPGLRGVRYDLNPAYLTADYEDSIVFCPTVFTSLVPKPLSGFGSMEFAPQNYRGEFTWRNIPDREKNPDSTVGFFRGIFANGSKPIFPNHGYVIRHKRSAPAVS